MTTQSLILSVRQAAQALAVSRVTVYELHKTDPTFPRIFKVAGRSSGILADELRAWAVLRARSHRIGGQSNDGGAA